MNASKKSLLIISGYIDDQRPMGGVTMHVHRLLKRLIEPQVSNYILCDYKKESFRKQLNKIRTAGVLHTHASNPLLKLFYVIAGKFFRTKSLITVHGKYGVYGPIQNIIHKWALKWCDIPILINKESYDAVVKFNSHAVFIPAFIPPIKEEEVLSSEMHAKIKQIKEDGKPLLVTNASSRAFTTDGKEIYGIEFLIDYCREHKEFNLVILDPHNDYMPLYKERLPENVYIFTGHHSFCGLMEYADIVVRNTPTDGDSLSVKEALYYHKKILATDAVSRPEGVFLFKYNSVESLDASIGKAITHRGIIDLKEENAEEQYLKLYQKVGVI